MPTQRPTQTPAQTPELVVLLPPREPGGHEAALFGWLADAVRCEGLRVAVHAGGAALRGAAVAAGLGGALRPAPGTRTGWLALLAATPRAPLLLAPGVLHAQAWLLAAAVLQRRAPWLYVPMAQGAAALGYRGGRLRDAALAPWLRRCAGVVAIDHAQAALLRRRWRVGVPVLALPNVARVASAPPAWPPDEAHGRLRVACVGRFDGHQKGLDWLAALLHARPPWAERCRWIFQGRGSFELPLLELASALGPQRVQVLPHAPLECALADSDVLLLASRHEGRPLVALEAMAHGWPVVASRQSRLAALLPRECRFEFGDARGLEAALDALRAPAARLAAARHAQARLAALLPQAGYDDARRALVARLRATPA